MQKKSPSLFLIFSLFGIFSLGLLGFNQDAYAVDGTVNDSTCGPTFGGVWDGVNTCTITGNIIVGPFETLTIPSGVNLVISNTSGTGITLSSISSTINNSGTITITSTSTSGSGGGIRSFGTINNSGTINVANSVGWGINNFGTINNNSGGIINVAATGNTGITNDAGTFNNIDFFGTLTNSGTITISGNSLEGILTHNTGTGITNQASGVITITNPLNDGIQLTGGTLTNSGTINVANSGGGSVGIAQLGGPLTNSGTINVANTGSNRGIQNSFGTGITNSGTIIISNSGNGVGIENAQILTNSGTINVANTGTTSGTNIGINNSNLAAILNNFGTITISNTGVSSIAISNNSGTINNNSVGIINVSNTGGTGILIGISLASTLNNSGTITISNTGGTGINNSRTSATLNNSGTITISNTGGTGINNSGTITNPGTIYNCGGTVIGTIPTTGNPIVPCPTASISINDVALAEGNFGPIDFDFTVTRSGDTTGASSVDFATADVTATSGSDYTSNSGTLNFAAGETTMAVTVLVNGDTAVEPDETFFVNLSSCVGCSIADNQGVGTILNDDSLPVDSDGDGIPDSVDECPNDPTNTCNAVTPAQAINNLVSLGNSLGANTSVLGNAVKLLNDNNPNNDNGACGKLNAFINQVNANKSLTSSQKTQLIQDANAIKTGIGC